MKRATIAVGLVLGWVLAGSAEAQPASTTTTLTSSIPGAFTTRPPVFTATVDTESSTPATGTVEFTADGMPLGQSPVFERGGHRIAVMGGATLAVGIHTITARYAGDDSHLASDSEPVSQWVSLGDYSIEEVSIFGPSSAVAVNDRGQLAGSLLGTFGRLPTRIGFLAAETLDLGVFGIDSFGFGLWTVPTAVNDAGQVAGRVAVLGHPFHAFLFSTQTRMKDLGTLGGATSQALAINGTGQVVGTSSTTSGATHGFLYSAGTLTDLGTLGGAGSAALAINASSSAAGYADLASGERHAACYTSTWRDLGTLGGTRSAAFTMNDAGQVAGMSLLAGDRDAHAFLWQDGQLTDLAGPDGPPTAAVAINDAGQAVGWTNAPGAGPLAFDAPSPRRAFLYSGGLNVLGTLRGGTSQALAVSNAGLVVGVSDGHAFVSNGGPLRDLGTRGGPTSIARAINDQGLIVGEADRSTIQHLAVAWKPVPVHALSVAAATGVVGRTTVLTATLKISDAPASGEQIDFALDAVAVGSATTDATGKAVLAGASLAGFAIGTYPGAVRATHAPSFALATADLVVTADHSPVAVDDFYEITGPLSVPAPGLLGNDTDPDRDALSAVLVSAPAHGTVTLAADGSFAYTPDPGSDPGTLPGDVFTYQVMAAGLPSNVAAVSLAGLVQPVFGGVVSAVPVTIDDSLTSKGRPRLSGDIVTYTTGTLGDRDLRYYDLGSGRGSVVPHSPDQVDDAPDVDAGRIVFVREQSVSPLRALRVFDTASGQLTTIAPEADPVFGGWSIAGDTVAFTNSLVVGIDPPIVDTHMATWDLATSTEARLETDDSFLFYGVPRISRDQGLIVWARCTAIDCDLFEARRTGGGWTTTVVFNQHPTLHDDPDTDGSWIVFTTAAPNFTSRIHLRPAGTADDRVLTVPGSPGRASIDGGVIAFTGGSGSLADVFVYVIATNTLYQVTDTPTVKALADVSVLPNGDVRVAWLEGSSGNVIRAVTFTPGH